MRVAVYNNKGGVGKTTTAVNLGAALARLSFRTLIVDMDPQRHVARHFGLDVEVGIEDALRRRSPVGLDDVIVPTADNLWVVPCTEQLNAARRELEARINNNSVLDSRLRKMSAEFDFIVLDTPPELSVLSRNAMFASDTILVPINLESFAVSGIDTVMDEIAELQEAYEDRGWTVRVVTLRYDGRLKHSNKVCGDEVEEVFGGSGYMLSARVRTDARLGAAQIAGRSIYDFDTETRPGKPPSKAAEDYMAMAMELVELHKGLKAPVGTGSAI